MEIPVLKVQARQTLGKQAATKLRQQGRIPAVCYGRDKKPLSFSLNTTELVSILRGPLGLNSLIRLDGAEDRTVFIQELQRDPVMRDIIHVDFLHIDPNNPVQRRVPVELVGKPEGVKLGGVLQVTARDILVEALPAQIPHKAVINVEPLLIGHSVHVKEVELPEGARAVYDRNYSICAVVSPTEEQAEAAEPEQALAAEDEKKAEAIPAEGKEKEPATQKKEEKSGSDKK